MPLADLPDDAWIHLVACEPPLRGAAAVPVIAALDKSLQQFAREGRCALHAVETAADGAVLAIAWTGDDLSGCSRDKLAQVLADRERRDGVALLAAPPLIVELPDGVRAIDRATLRAAIAAGTADAATMVHDRRVQRLGDWRARGRVRLGESWLAELVPR